MRTGAPWPQVVYCVQAMGALATRCILELAMQRPVRHVVVFDVHDAMRTQGQRIRQWLGYPALLARALRAARVPRSRPAQTQNCSEGQRLPKDADIQSVLEAMVLAPSPHNCQPWTFANLSGRRIGIRRDHARSTPIVDPLGLAVDYTVGCAVEAASQVADVTWEPASDGCGDEYGVLHVHGIALDRYARGRGLLQSRSTWRGRMLDVSPHRQLKQHCAELATQCGAVALFGEVDPSAMVRLAQAGAHRHFSQPAYVEELFQYIRTTAAQSATNPTGFSAQSLLLSAIQARFIGLLKVMPTLRRIAVATVLPSMMSRESVRHLHGHSTYVLVAAQRWDRQGRVDAGRALMRVWLALSANGMHCQPVDFPISSELGRDEVAAMFGIAAGARPIALLRVGFAIGEHVPAAARLPVDAVTCGELT
jgi:nitroreductase